MNLSLTTLEWWCNLKVGVVLKVSYTVVKLLLLTIYIKQNESFVSNRNIIKAVECACMRVFISYMMIQAKNFNGKKQMRTIKCEKSQGDSMTGTFERL